MISICPQCGVCRCNRRARRAAAAAERRSKVKPVPIIDTDKLSCMTWPVIALEITKAYRGDVGLPLYTGTTRTGVKYPIGFPTTPCFTGPKQDVAREQLKDLQPGHTLFIWEARLGRFGRFRDGTRLEGFRVEDMRSVDWLPFSLAELEKMQCELRDRRDAGQHKSCSTCKTRCKKRCEECHTRYCSKDCQKSDWPNHKQVCKAVKMIDTQNVLDLAKAPGRYNPDDDFGSDDEGWF